MLRRPLWFFFWPRQAACGILVPQPGIEHAPLAVEAWSPNRWTAREVLLNPFLTKIPELHGSLT